MTFSLIRVHKGSTAKALLRHTLSIANIGFCIRYWIKLAVYLGYLQGDRPNCVCVTLNNHSVSQSAILRWPFKTSLIHERDNWNLCLFWLNPNRTRKSLFGDLCTAVAFPKSKKQCCSWQTGTYIELFWWNGQWQDRLEGRITWSFSEMASLAELLAQGLSAQGSLPWSFFCHMNYAADTK